MQVPRSVRANHRLIEAVHLRRVDTYVLGACFETPQSGHVASTHVIVCNIAKPTSLMAIRELPAVAAKQLTAGPGAKRPKAVAKITDDLDVLLAF
jgi:hypothetical protein